MATLTNTQRITALEKRASQAESRLAALETTADDVDATLTNLIARVEALEGATGTTPPPPPPPPDPTPPSGTLVASGPVHSTADGQIIEWLDITVTSGTGIEVTHDNVTVRNCRVRHGAPATINVAHGVRFSFCASPRIENCEIIHAGPFAGANARQSVKENRHNIEFEGVTGTPIINNVICRSGARNIYILDSPCAGVISNVQLEDARGLDDDAGGNNIQINHSAGWTIHDFSCKNGSSSFTEDNVNLGDSPNCKIYNGRVHYNNSPSGDGVMLELGSSNCTVTDVDCTSQGNGAFAAVGTKGCSFTRCRTRDTYNSARDGRAAPTSNGLSYYVTGGPHTITTCKYFNLANPSNIIFQQSAAPGYQIASEDFTPRAYVAVSLPWL